MIEALHYIVFVYIYVMGAVHKTIECTIIYEQPSIRNRVLYKDRSSGDNSYLKFIIKFRKINIFLPLFNATL